MREVLIGMAAADSAVQIHGNRGPGVLEREYGAKRVANVAP